MSTKEPRIRILMELPNKPIRTIECSTVDEAVSVLLRYICEVYPSYEIVSKMTLTIDIEKLMRDMQGLAAIAPEGPVVLKMELPADVAIKCCLTEAYIGNKLGKLSKDSLLAEDIAKLTGKALKTVRNELPKMVKQGVVDKVGKGEYRITTIGITRFSAEDLPKLKAVSK